MDQKPRKIDPNKASSSPKMSMAVEQILDSMEQQGVTVPRTQPKSLQKLVDHINVILSNLSSGDWISYRHAKGGYKLNRSKQGFQFTSANVRKVVIFLEKEGFIERDPGFKFAGDPGKLSRMKATGKLKELLSRVETHQDATGMPLVIVRGVKDKEGKRKVCKTPDNGTVRAMEENLLLINKVIQAAKIELNIQTEKKIDFSKRYLYRSFHDRRLDRGGRFYGGFWIALPKDIRKRLLINGMPVWEFDFSGMQPNIIYGMAGINPPPGGAYGLPDYSPGYRSLIKTFFLRMLFTHKTRHAILSMQDIPPDSEDIPEGVDLYDWLYMFKLADDIKAHNQQIIKYLDGPKVSAGELQWNESEIMERVLVHFALQNIPCLPVHDSMVLPLDYSWECIGAMKAAFKERFNQDIEVTGTMLEGLLDALDRAPRTPDLVALAHKVALEIAKVNMKLFPGDKGIYQAVKQHLEENPV